MIVYNTDDDEGDRCWLSNSYEIFEKFLPEELYPKDIKDDIRQLEIDIGKRISTAGRCFIYYHMLNNLSKYKTTLVTTCANQDCTSKVEHVLFDTMIDKGLGTRILQSVEVTQDGYEASCSAIRQIFQELSQRLERNGGGGEYYLMDTPTRKYGFTAADVTFAASSAMLLMPPETKPIYGEITSCVYPPEYIQLQQDLLQTTAGKHVLNVYKKHRGGVVTMKVVNRNKYPWQSLPRKPLLLVVMGATMGVVAVAIAAVALAANGGDCGGSRTTNNNR